MPALEPFPPETWTRDLGSPSALRCLRVNGFSGGGGLGEGEDSGDSDDSEENPEGESPGVSASGSAILTSTSTSTSLSSPGSCDSSGAMSCDKREGGAFRLRALLDADSEVSEWEEADDSSNVRFGDLNGRGSRSEPILGIMGYGGGVGRDEGGSEEPAGEGERDMGRGISVGAGGGGVGETAAIFTGFDADLRSLRFVGVVTVEGCLEVGFCLTF